MSAMNSYIGRNNKGRDYNFFRRISVSNTTFGVNTDGYLPGVDGYYPDAIITFPTVNGGVIFITEGTSTNTVEYSFNGNTVHGELIPGTTSDRRTLTFYHRNISTIWFRVKSGSTGPISIVVEAWSGA
jgi:hypothetical protein